MEYINDAGTINLNCYLQNSINALDIYKYTNPQHFEDNIPVNILFDDSLREIYNIHNQKYNPVIVQPIPLQIQTNKKVLLAFSGGLDSVYQAFILRESYDVTLFHVKNMNYYTNGKEYQVCEEFSKTYNFPIVYAQFKQNTKNNTYKKYWKENSFKNLLLYSMMLDYCIDNTISNISSGDDLRLDIKDAVVGTNIADAFQVTLPFMKRIKEYYNIDFIPTNGNIDKAQRIQKLKEYNALDMFYSCVNPGRFNQSNHNRINKKYNIQMEKWNCGVCRKCAFHSLLRYYYLNENYPQEFIDFCWEKICVGADYEFFKPSLPMEQRIKNLIAY